MDKKAIIGINVIIFVFLSVAIIGNYNMMTHYDSSINVPNILITVVFALALLIQFNYFIKYMFDQLGK